MSFRLRTSPLLAIASLLLAAWPCAAQPDDDYEDDGIRQGVARLSWFEGEVSFNRGDDPDDWQSATVNYPMTLGDRVWAASNARAVLQLQGGAVYLAPQSELSVLDLMQDVRQLSLTWGTATFRIRALTQDETFEVATPNVSVSFETPGVYRIDVDEEGSSVVTVFQGRASAAAGGGQVDLARGDVMRVQGLERPDYDIVGLGRADAWDRWVELRARRFRSIRSASYVHPDIYGIEDLDMYGSWEESSDYGSVWFPRVTGAEWEPYRSGRWIWRDPWGWTWLSSEPWGWAPYHHGRWALMRGRWGWIPVGPQAAFAGYFPAVVGFVGGGPGWSASVSAGGFVGWFPLGPREPFHPWWFRSRRQEDRSDYRYAYRNRVVVVSRDVFIRGKWGDRDLVRDPRVLRDISAAPILRGPIPVLPTRDSIRIPRPGAGTRDVSTPPQRAAGRPVVVRREAPPPPPTFDRKLEVIRERGGQPIRVEDSRRLPIGESRGDRPAAPVRPVTRDGIALSPRSDVAPSRRPVPLPSPADRPASTYDRPTPRPAAETPVREPAPPIRRGDVQPRSYPQPVVVNTPALRRVDTPEPRRVATPEQRRFDAPEPRRVEAPEPRRVDTPVPYRVQAPEPQRVPERVPTAEPRLRREPPPTPRVERAPEPERAVSPYVPRREAPVAEPRREAAPREEARPRPAGKAEEAKPAKDNPKPPKPEAAPTKPPSRRIIPEPS